MDNEHGTEDEAFPTAYCAPGQKMIAALALALNGERVREIVEHSWLVKGDDIILIAPPDDLLVGPMEIELPDWSTVLPHCGLCDGILPYHNLGCYTRSCGPPLSALLITGLN